MKLIQFKDFATRTLVWPGLIAGWLFLISGVPKHALAQDCSLVCDSLELVIVNSSANSCDIVWESSFIAEPLFGYEPIESWAWFLDGNPLPDSVLSMDAAIAQLGGMLSLTVELQPLDTLQTCACTTEVDLAVALLDYDWPCSCQPGGPPVAGFSVEGAELCGGPLGFVSEATGLDLSFDWSFGVAGEFGVSTEVNPSVVIVLDGGGVTDVPVTLVVTDANGCQASVTESVAVLEVPNPVFASVIPLCTGGGDWPAEYTLINLGGDYLQSNDLSEIGLDWGNGNAEILESIPAFFSISTEYTAYGYYTLAFTGVGNNGCTNVVEEVLFVGSNPEIGSANPGNTLGLCAPDSLVFPISSFESNDPSTLYEVSFGDGMVSTFPHPPPAFVSHVYETTSCEADEGPIPNSFVFTVTATNDCSSSYASVAPIQVFETTPPSLEGPATICSEVAAVYQVTGGVQNEVGSNCVFQSSTGDWNVVPLEGQALAQPSSGAGSSFQTSFSEPGLYQIEYEDSDGLQSWSPCPYDPTDAMEVCVVEATQPQVSWSALGNCVPFDVNLTNETPAPPCGNRVFNWLISGGAYTWAPGSSASDENPSVTLLDPATYTLSLEITYAGAPSCSATSSQIVISAAQAPEVFIGDGGSICQQDNWNATVLVNPGNSVLTDFTWTIDGVEVGGNSPGPLNEVFDTPGTYIIVASASNACGTDQDEQSLVVQPLPVIEVIGPSTFCNDATIVLEASGAESYLWSATVPEVNGNTLASVAYVMDGLLIGSVTGTVDYGTVQCSATESFQVFAFPSPNLAITGDEMVCDGSAFELQSQVTGVNNNFYTVEWIQNGDTLEGLTFSGFVDSPNEMTSSVQAIVTTYAFCSDTAEFTVGVWDLPVVEATDGLVFCNQAIEVALEDGTPIGGTWSGLGVDGNGWFNPGGLPLGSADLEYTVVDSNGCANSDITAAELILPIFANAGEDLQSCESDEVIELAGYTPAMDGVWSGSVLSDPALATIDLGGLEPGVFGLMYAYGEETCYTTDSMYLEVLETPVASIALVNSVVCDQDTVSVQAYGEGGTLAADSDYVVTWSSNVEVDPLDPAISSVVTDLINGPTTVSVTVTDDAGCAGAAELAIEPIALPEIIMPELLDECNQDYQFELPEAFPLGGTWSGPGIVDPIEGLFNPAVAGPGSVTLTYTGTSAAGCVNSDSVVFQVVDPLLADAGADFSVCNSSEQLTLEGFTPTAGGTWTGQGVVDGTLGVIQLGLLANGSHPFVYTYGAGSCAHSDTLIVEVLDNPSVVVETNAAVVCDGDLAIWTATASGGNVADASDYQFSWLGEAMADPDNPMVASWVAVGTDLTGSAFLTVTDTAGCQVEVTSIIYAEAPPIFTLPEGLLECDQSSEIVLPAADPSGGIWVGPGVIDGLAGTFDPGAVGEGQWYLQYQFTDTYGCFSYDSTAVEVVGLEVAEAGEDLVTCEIDDSIQFEGFYPAQNGVWSGSGVLDPSAGLIDASALTPGVYAFNYAHGSGSCYSEDVLELTVLELPSLNWLAPATMCLDSSDTFYVEPVGGLAPHSILWLTPMDAVALDSLSATTSWSTAGAQSLEALVTDANGCAQASVVDLDVLAPPTIEAGPDIVLCNQPIPEQLTGFSPGFSTGGTGGFYGVDGVADAVTSDGWFDPASSGEGTFEVVYEFMSSTTGCSNRDTLLVQVVAPTVAEAGPDVTVCINAPALQLSDFNPASGGSWAGLTGEANTAIIDAANGILNPQALSAGSHTFEITFGTGTCFSSDQMTVLIDPLPEITLASDDAFCANAGIVSVTEATPAGGIWDGGGVSTDGMFDVSQGAGIYALEYAYTDPTTLCSDTAVHEVEVLELPAVNAGLDISFCNQPIPAQLTGFSPGLTEGGDGMFYGLEEAVSAVSVEGLFDPSASGQGTFEVVYEFTSDVTGCMHNDTLVVEVTAPIAITAGVDTTVCINAPLLQLEGFLPLIGVTWSGVSPDAQNALVDAANGLVNPQLLPAGSHLFELSVGAGTCLSTDQRAVFVQSLPVITLASSSEFCGYEAVEPLATPSPNGGLWLGTGLDDASLGLFDTDQPAGAYALSYTYTDPLTLCADTVAYDVVIHPVPVAGFAAPTLACINLPWDITQTTSGGDDAVWEFGNTENSTEWEPDYTFPSIGVFDVEMVASNAQGCLDTTGVQVEITAPPVASFQVSTDNGCAPLDVSFTNDSYAPFATFDWEVNGEFFADEESPVQTFLEGPDVLVYDVLLTVSNLCGSSSEPQQITVLPQPQLGFALLEDTVCSPYIAEILNTSLGNPDVLQWDFGNGQTDVGGSPLWPTYVVDDEPVLFEIQLTGSNACGSGAFNTTILVQPNTTQAFFDLSVESGCAPLEVTVADLSVDATQFTFDFDNGFTSLDSLATSVFEDAGEYTITQYITNGCSFDTTSVTIEVFAEPVFSMSSDSPAYCEGEEGVFLVETAGSETVDWEFGQGDSGVGVEVSQAWDEEGAYWVVATVATALYACIASDSILVEIHATPVLDVSADFTSGCAPLAVSFSNASEDADFWLWDFADNSSDGILFELDHTFPNDGTEIAYYNVEVTGSTVESCEASATIQIAVFPLPEIIFTLDASSGCGDPSTVQVLNASPGQLDFMWYLDDILGGTSFGPSIDVGGLGMHTITMQATNTYGCQLSQDQPFEVFANPLPALSLDPMSGCVPLELFVDDQSTGAATSTLFVGLNGGLVYEGPVPVDPMILNQVGSHTVGLEVVSADGCVQQLELEETVEVWPVPQVSFYADPYAGTSTNPDPLNSAWNFENESTDGLSSVWDFGDGGFSSEWDTYHTYSHSGIYPVTLTVYNGYGCFRDFTQVIEVLENLQVFVPTAFTPPSGGYADGVNDGWRPEISDASLVDQYDLWIYNRWGQLVWHSQDPEAYWIGEAQNDGDYFAVNDVYTWVLQLDSSMLPGSSREWRGHVTLFR